MKPEILLKAYVLYESEDAFRELVDGSLDEVYSTALRIIDGPPHLVEDTVLRVYWDLARKAPSFGHEVVLTTWLRKRTCKIAAIVLRQEDRPVNRAALKREKRGLSAPHAAQSAPPGLATRVCQGILLNLASHKGFSRSLRRLRAPAWFRLPQVAAAALCVLVIILVWKLPFHKQHPIVMSPALQLTPASFAQLATPDEADFHPDPGSAATTNAEAGPNKP